VRRTGQDEKQFSGKISRRGESQVFWRVKRRQPSSDEPKTEDDWRDTKELRTKGIVRIETGLVLWELPGKVCLVHDRLRG
jgi:hypothetical protein